MLPYCRLRWYVLYVPPGARWGLCYDLCAQVGCYKSGQADRVFTKDVRVILHRQKMNVSSDGLPYMAFSCFVSNARGPRVPTKIPSTHILQQAFFQETLCKHPSSSPTVKRKC